MISDNTQAEPLDKTAVKCRFFASYWGQTIQAENSFLKFEIDEHIFPISNEDYECVLLKSISKITDEDALYIALSKKNENGKKQVLKNKKRSISNIKRYYLNNLYTINVETIDYLRMQGYAIPFLGYSVEDLISFGWVRLV